MTFQFLVTVELVHLDGPTASRELVRKEIVSAIQSIDMDTYVDDSMYQVRAVEVAKVKR